MSSHALHGVWVSLVFVGLVFVEAEDTVVSVEFAFKLALLLRCELASTLP